MWGGGRAQMVEWKQRNRFNERKEKKTKETITYSTFMPPSVNIDFFYKQLENNTVINDCYYFSSL